MSASWSDGIKLAVGLVVGTALVGCLGNGSRRDADAVREANALSGVLTRTAARELGSDEVRVRLAFGAEADLDLYVTDPRTETVYFANSPSRSGGRLEADLRCDAAPPRIETVTFRPATPGRYRVGVDFPERCDGRDAVSFVVSIEHGPTRREQRGSIRLHEFLTVVLEADVQP